ncbi:hypothetical protein L1987_27043 [Smallanthus sonchifolius]|uniref:Uncharacterized protein n=1 Tax=Smallanthus sonchifolius TaxID=185202 RepID=A0ACB9IAC4_9ASTR|nr:hypothetical protein L1987_27043 [Smallanthus sonchifolius]
MLSLRTRSSPKSLSDATRTLSDKQLDCVRAMGFGKMLSFNVDGILGLLGNYVVDNLDTESMTIKLERGPIQITKESEFVTKKEKKKEKEKKTLKVMCRKVSEFD